MAIIMAILTNNLDQDEPTEYDQDSQSEGSYAEGDRNYILSPRISSLINPVMTTTKSPAMATKCSSKIPNLKVRMAKTTEIIMTRQVLSPGTSLLIKPVR